MKKFLHEEYRRRIREESPQIFKWTTQKNEEHWKKKMKKENKKKKLENLREPWKNRQESSSVMKVSAKKSAKTRTDLNTSRESQRIFKSPQWEGGEAEEGEKKKKFHRSPKESRTPNSSSLPPPSQKRIFNKEFQ